jgi:hypothetical protein
VARNGKKSGDGKLILALASGCSVPRAARKAGVSLRTAYRRLEDPDFRRRVEEARSRLVERACGRLASLGGLAVGQLHALLSRDTTGEQGRLGAARAALDFLFRSHEQHTLAKQLDDLKRQLEEVSRRGHGNAAAAGPQAEGGAGPVDPAGDPTAGQDPPRPGDHPELRGDAAGPLAGDVTPLDL